MCQFSNGHHSPSWIIESTTCAWPMRRPSRTRGSRYGRVAHRLHAAGHRDLDVAGLDALVREHHRLQARAAHLVDGQRGDVVGEPALERRLARRRLAGAGRDDVAHDAFVDRRRVDAGARDRFADDQRAQLRRGEILERAEELAGGHADGADDDGFGHDETDAPGEAIHAPARARTGAAACRRSTSIAATAPLAEPRLELAQQMGAHAAHGVDPLRIVAGDPQHPILAEDDPGRPGDRRRRRRRATRSRPSRA